MGLGQFQGPDFLALFEGVFKLPQHVCFALVFQLELDDIPGFQRYFFTVHGGSECCLNGNISCRVKRIHGAR